MDSNVNFGVGSFTKTFSYPGEDLNEHCSVSTSDVKPRILLMGLRRSGKSSIQKVGLLYKIVLYIFQECFCNTYF